MNDVKFYKMRDVRDPERGTTQSAGIDLFVPVIDCEFVEEFRRQNPDGELYTIKGSTALSIRVRPGELVKIPMGVGACITYGTALIAHNKTGVAAKKNLCVMFDTIDSDFSGEIIAGVRNLGGVDVFINGGNKLIQLIHTPVILGDPGIVDKEFFDAFHSNSERGTGMYGHTDEK